MTLLINYHCHIQIQRIPQLDSLPSAEADYSDLVKMADQAPHEKVNIKVGPSAGLFDIV